MANFPLTPQRPRRDVLDRQADHAERIRRLEAGYQVEPTDRAAPVSHIDVLLEWLYRGAGVRPPLDTGREAWHLYAKEKAITDEPLRRALRNLRVDLGLMKGLVRSRRADNKWYATAADRLIISGSTALPPSGPATLRRAVTGLGGAAVLYVIGIPTRYDQGTRRGNNYTPQSEVGSACAAANRNPFGAQPGGAGTEITDAYGAGSWGAFVSYFVAGIGNQLCWNVGAYADPPAPYVTFTDPSTGRKYAHLPEKGSDAGAFLSAEPISDYVHSSVSALTASVISHTPPDYATVKQNLVDIGMGAEITAWVDATLAAYRAAPLLTMERDTEKAYLHPENYPRTIPATYWAGEPRLVKHGGWVYARGFITTNGSGPGSAGGFGSGPSLYIPPEFAPRATLMRFYALAEGGAVGGVVRAPKPIKWTYDNTGGIGRITATLDAGDRTVLRLDGIKWQYIDPVHSG